jgi:hypothetical protein
LNLVRDRVKNGPCSWEPAVNVVFNLRVVITTNETVNGKLVSIMTDESKRNMTLPKSALLHSVVLLGPGFQTKKAEIFTLPEVFRSIVVFMPELGPEERQTELKSIGLVPMTFLESG